MTKKQKDKIFDEVTALISHMINNAGYCWTDGIQNARLTRKEKAWAKKHLDWKVYEVKP